MKIGTLLIEENKQKIIEAYANLNLNFGGNKKSRRITIENIPGENNEAN